MPSPLPRIDIGAKLGAYAILDVLGRGSQGIVYLAEAANGERVALKVLRPDADEAARARFLREAATTASIRHDGIVRVLAHGEAPGGLLWYAMELVEAPSLEKRLSSKIPIEPRLAAHLVAALARAVHFAHEKGILHRDLKPANVLLAGGSIYRPKIADFGLALVQGQTRLTQTNAFVGTPCYLAPEIIRGEKPSRASDIYAIGAILYECLAGRPPHVGPTIASILDRALKTQATPPRHLRKNVPAPLERLCMQCLEKQPHHRPTSAAAVEKAIERWLGGGPPKRIEAARESIQDAWAGVVRSSGYLLGGLVGLEVGFLIGILLARAT